MNYKYIILDFGKVIAGPTTGHWDITPKFLELIDINKINIEKFNLLNRDFGYNINPGGAAPHKFSDLELKKRSDSIKEKWNVMDRNTKTRILTSLQDGYKMWINNITEEEKMVLYKRRSVTMRSKPQEEKDKINQKRIESRAKTISNRSLERDEEIRKHYSEASKKRWDNTPPETKEALRQTIIKSVYCPQLDRKFDSIKDASIFTSAPSSNIVKVCKGERKYAGKTEDGTQLTWIYL